MTQRLPIEVVETLLRAARELAFDCDMQALADAIDSLMHDEVSPLMGEIDRMSEHAYVQAVADHVRARAVQ